MAPSGRNTGTLPPYRMKHHTLRGYRWGVERKKKLLEREKGGAG
jgi:hypothetical protein